ncbi:BRO domain-containing protein [Liquorilactobacillus aquaticus DSM 21051]|uniref:BRO domain-containing protein n=1 Tax=Liquorilactobacillus aquaticus DSM 21051 TaxID=1423725 RepID=A0A0R2CVV2_9LACO|nr:ORF6C domain-containing protein [Liquorilactobacillus aquaticus]KRM95983.1 BRO domain-containing protein [Liquorilactobacillus aquaticus DSM 21051]
MNRLQHFTNGDIDLPILVKENGEINFDVEQAAIGLGLTKIVKGNLYVRWERVNEYLKLSNSGQRLKQRGDFITEPQFYKLAIKANNQTAERFQDWVTEEVLPSIRKTGSYFEHAKLPKTPMETLELMFEAQKDSNKKVEKVEKRVGNLEENQVIPQGDYSYISRRIGQRVTEVGRGFGKLTSQQRGELFKDINSGVKKIAGVGSRSQLRTKHYQMVVDFINDWEPATATKTVVRQMSLDIDDESA